MSPAFADRERDLLDALALGQITKMEFAKLHEELTRDYYETQTVLHMALEAERTENESLRCVRQQVPERC